MNVPTNSEILALLDRLASEAADDLESQWLDFKPWTDAKSAMKVAVEYAVCFANADGGVVVFGVADRTRERAAAIHGAKASNLDVRRRGIFDGTRFLRKWSGSDGFLDRKGEPPKVTYRLRSEG